MAALTNSQGRIVESYAYDEYGRPLSGSLSGNRYLFTAREYDRETGLYYYRARYYDPGLGRFLQADPVGYEGGMNLYAYVRNNSVNLKDPFGLDYWVEGAAPGEPPWHESLAVGDPEGEYESYSFGATGGMSLKYGLEGEVYKDPVLGGEIKKDSYRKTTPEEDKLIKAHLESEVATRGSYGFYNCRSYSRQKFDILSGLGFGEKSAYPTRKISTGEKISGLVSLTTGRVQSTTVMAASTASKCKKK